MKKLILTFMAMFLTIGLGVARADSTSTSTNTNTNSTTSGSTASTSGTNSQGQQQGQQQASQSSSGNNFNQDFGHNTSTGSDLSRMVPSVAAPALTTTLTETCMGSTSVGVGWSGAGISFGTTWRDSACVRRLDARELKTIRVPGAHYASKELMCDSDKVRAAFLRAGFPCAEDGGVPVRQAAVAPAMVSKKPMKAKPDYKKMSKDLDKKLDSVFEKQMRK